MKKITAVVICLFMLCTFFSAYADENVTVYINGKLINFDVQPIVIDGRTLVPMRKLFEELGATVEWDNTNNTAIGYSKGVYVAIPIGKNDIIINEIYEEIDVPSQEINGRTLVPLRVISEVFGMNVNYDDSTKTVNMTSTNKIGRYDKGNKYYYGHIENGLPGDFGEVYDTATDTLLEAGSFDSDLNRLFGVAYLKGNFNGRRYTGTINYIGNNAVYDGGMINGVFCGHGKYTWADGDVYEGEYKDGKQNGYGKYTWSDGDVYEGEFKDDALNGSGKFTCANGDIYEGEYKDDKQNGYGKYTWSNGDIYEGEFKDGALNGSGKFTCANGDIYEGEYKDGKQNGYGKYTWAAGDVYEGEWKDDKQNGRGKYMGANGTVFEGEWSDGERNGIGKYTWSDGAVYEGEWKDDKANGIGRYTWSNGDVYEGEFKNGKRNGYGRYVYTDGSVQAGYWENDIFIWWK